MVCVVGGTCLPLQQFCPSVTKATESLGQAWVRNVNLCQGRQLQALAK